MYKNIFIVLVVVFVGCVFSQPKMYKGVYLSDGTPAMLDLSDSSLVDIGKDWTVFTDTMFTEIYQSTPQGYFIKANLWHSYYILKNPGAYPIKQWGYGRLVYKINAGKWLTQPFLLPLFGSDNKNEQEVVLYVKTPDDNDNKVAEKGKKAYWVWKPNPKGAKAGRLEFR